MSIAAPAWADELWWDPNRTDPGLGGNGTWNTSDSFWSDPTVGQTVPDGTSGPYNVWDNGALHDAWFGVTAGTITLAEPITAHSLNFQSMHNWVLNGSTLTLDGVDPYIFNAGTVTINSVVDSTSGLTKTGGGLLILNANNNFSGGLIVDAGTLSLTGDNSFGNSPTINGGSLSLTGTNTFTGDIDINGGALTATGAAALGDAGNNFDVTGNATLNVGTTGGTLSGRTVSATGGTLTVQGAGVGSARFTGDSNVTISGGGVVMNNDTNDYTGTTSFASSASFTSIGNLGEASSLGAPTTVANGTISVTGGNSTSTIASYIGDGDISDRNWSFLSFARSAVLDNAGSGTLTLTGDISVGSGSQGTAAQFRALTADLELLGVISGGNISFTANSGRTVTLGDANTSTGGVSIAGAGEVRAGTLADYGTASSLGTGGTSSNIGISGTLSYVGDGDSSNRNWTLSNGTLNSDGSGALALTGNIGISGTATLGGSFTGANNVSAGVISGSGNLRSGGDATWVLSGTNTYAGDTLVDSGTLRAGSADAFGDSTEFVINGGTLDLNNFDQTLTTLNGTGGTLDLGSATLTMDGPTGTSATFAGSIIGSGGLTKLGASTQTLTGASTYTGDTTIGGGTLNLDFSTAGGPTSNIIGSDSTLNVAGGTLNIVGAAGESNTQTFDGLNITAGNNIIDASSGTGGTMTVNLGAITRTGGLINFNLPESGNITTTNVTLGGWATVNGTDYAKVEGGNILAFEESDYTDKDNAGTWLDNEYITDVDGFFGTVNGSIQLAGLRYTQPVSTTVTVQPGETLGVDGTIIVAPSVLSTNQLISGGMMTGAIGGVLGVQQNSTGNFTIASQIVDNGGAIGFTKSGTGQVTLTSPDSTYTGATQVLQGTLAVATIGNGGEASSIGASSADSSNLLIQGSKLQYIGGTAASDRGFTFSTSGAILGSEVEVTDANANLTLSGLVTSPDAASFTKSGAGTLTLANGANDYTGITTVTGGMLGVTALADGGQVSSIGQSSSASANLVLNGGGLQYTGGTVTTDRGFTLGVNDGTVDVTDAAATLTFTGNVVGAGGALTKEGDGTLVLSGTNTYNGGNTINAGVLRAGSTQAFGAGPVTLADVAGATLDLDGFDNLIGALNGGGASGGNVTLGDATLRINGGNGDYSGTISGTGGLWRTGGGTQTFNGCNNTYTGPTTLQGALSTDCLADGGDASGIGASSAASSNLVFNGGTLIYTGDSISIDRGFQLTGGGIVNVATADTTLEFTGDIIGGAALRKDGVGTLVLSGNNTSTGATHVNTGTLRAGSTSAFGRAGMTIDNESGVLLDLDGYDNTVGFLNGGGANGGNIELDAATLTLDWNSGSANYGGAISGSGDLVKEGALIQRLSGCNSSYTGATVINGGELEVNCLTDGGVNSSIGASTSDPSNLVIDGGTLDYIGSGDSTNRQFTLGTNAGTISSTGTGAIAFTNTGSVTLSGTNAARTLTLTGTNTGANIFSAQLDDNGTGATSLTKTGTGRWRLTNDNSTYTGITTISGGILEIDQMADGGMASSIGASSNAAANLVIGNGSTLRYSGAGDTTDRQFTLDTGVTYIESSGTGPLVFSNTGAVTLTGTNTPRTIALGGTNTGFNTMGGAIGDNGSGATTLAKNDSGTWVLTGNNSYSGNTVINNGNLMIGNGGTTGNAGVGNVIVDSPTSILSLNRSDTFTFDGTLSGPGTLAQIGTGTSVLTSATNAIGATTISAGTLEVAGGLDTPAIAMTGTSTLTVSGSVQAAGPTQVAITGDAGANTVKISAGGTLRASGDLGGGSDVVTVAGLIDTGAGTLALGAGNDKLTLYDGAVISGGGVEAGAGTDTLEINNALTMILNGASVGGFEALTKDNTGTLTLIGNHGYANGTTISDGTVQIGNGGSSGTLASDVVNDGTLAFNRSNTYTFSGQISGSGTVEQIGSGTTILTGDNTYSGPTSVQAGSLLINGDQSGATGLTSVDSGATLGGTGIIGGGVTVADGAALTPGGLGVAPGTLTIIGDLGLNPAADLNYNFGQANVVGGPLNDLTEVGGDLVLDGTLNVTETPGGSMIPGIYRIFSYNGALTDNGLALGTMPPGDFLVQTAIANQVNLANATGVTLNFWDGPGGTPNDASIQGGDGVWRLADNIDWTNDTGQINAPYSNAAFAVFAGQPGTVTIDNGNGLVEASGLQFAADGYVIDGAPLTLVGGSSIIRVGDGSSVGRDMIATISAELTGGSVLVKADLGTLVLSGINTYAGGTTIEDGTLQVSADTNLGDTAGGITLDGGTLQNSASFTSSRAITLDVEGGTFLTDAGTTLTLGGNLDGTGGLTKAGTGTLLLTGTSSYDGATTVAEGTLQAGGTGAFNPSSAFAVEADGTLDLAGFDQTVASLTNAGTLMLSGGPGTTLTVLGNYVGDGGTLWLNTELGADDSPTDRLVVNGDSSGSTDLRVANFGGGGVQTGNGIKVVQVDGASNGTFNLLGDYVYEGDQAVVGGAFAYRLYKGGVSTPADGDWYLRSALIDDPSDPLYQPGVPLYEAYAGSLQAFNRLGTLQQRVGNRSWVGRGPGVVEAGNDDANGVWARIEAAHAEFEPKISTSGIDYDAAIWRIQAGVDGLLAESEAGRLVAGGSVHYGVVSSNVTSVHGNGSIGTNSIGLGGTLTWYDASGFYLDGQAQVTWYDSDLHSATARRSLVSGNDGMGYALSLEAGQRVALDEGWALTPQAQLSYSSVHYDDFTDSFGADVSLDGSESLVGRLGIAVDHQSEWQDAQGRASRTHLYGIANVYYDFADDSQVDVSGTPLTTGNDNWRGGLGLGWSVNMADDKFSLHGEVLANTSLENFGHSNVLSGTVGVRVTW